MRAALRILCLSLLVGTAFAQSDRGTLTGTIADPAGAVVAGATIEAKNSATGAQYTTVSTATGNYTLAQLPAGVYQLTVSMAGFKHYVRQGITVQVAATFRIDVALEVGAITETVTVTSEAPLLKTESGELSHNISTDRLNGLPAITIGGAAGLGNVRNPLQVLNLLPGTSFTNDSALRVNGMPSSTQAIRIEGQDATNGIWRVQNQVMQSGLDAIQEVSVQTSNFAAEYGQAGGGYFNYTMKSGTNQFHGGAYDYLVNEMLNAGTPFTNDGTGGHIKNKQRRNDYGFTLGGPIRIPKIYNGTDKSFFFFNFEQFREALTIGTGVATVPTAAYRLGDFRQALGPQLTRLGVPVVDPDGRPVFQNEIYNPSTTRLGPNNTVLRDPFMGCDGATMNVICQDKTNPRYYPFDAVAARIQALLPDPRGSGAGNLINNYAVPDYQNWRHTTIASVKIDHSLSPTIKLSGYFSETITRSPSANGYTQDFTTAQPQDTHSYTSRLNYDQTLRPTLLLHVGVGYVHTNIPSEPKKVDLSKIGFKQNFFIDRFPQITGLNNAQRGGTNIGIGSGFGYKYAKEFKPTANVSLTWVKGNHTIKAGGEMVIEGLPTYNYTRANGVFAFDANQTAIPWEDGAGFNSTTGFPYASFLTGRDNSLAVSQVTLPRLGNHSIGLFVQDTWKITRRLTLDYGLRYDFATLLREQYGRMQNASFTTPNPAAGGRLGSMIYEATCNCRYNDNYPFAFGPRLGVAYQINSKTVFRAGAGIAYGSSSNNSFLSLSAADFYTYTRDGFGNPATILADGNPRPNLVWPDFGNNYPFPSLGGLRPPSQPFVSIAKNAGRLPRIFQWSIGLQREVMRNLVVDVAYVGNRGAWWTAPLLATQNYNALTPEGLKSQRAYGNTTGLDVTNAADRGLLLLPISNPSVIAKFPQLADPNSVYPGFPASQPLNQALRPIPQWLGVPPFLGPPLGNTWYDALQAKVTRRFSHGLDFQGAFTWQKELTLGANADTSFIGGFAPRINDVFNRMSNKQISEFSRPFALVVSLNYTTPKFLEGRGTGFKALSLALGDWTLGTVLRYQSGDLIRTPSSNNGLLNQLARGPSNNPAVWGGGATFWNRNPGVPLLNVDPNCHCFDPNTKLVLNPAAWTDAPAGTFGTSASIYNDYRWQRQPSESLSIGRNFRVRERTTIQIRAEFQNIFNRVFLSMPTNTNPSLPTTSNAQGNLTGGYGYINTVSGAGTRPRSGQIVARISF